MNVKLTTEQELALADLRAKLATMNVAERIEALRTILGRFVTTLKTDPEFAPYRKGETA
jgi:hypothetical protein